MTDPPEAAKAEECTCVEEFRAGHGAQGTCRVHGIPPFCGTVFVPPSPSAEPKPDEVKEQFVRGANSTNDFSATEPATP